MKRNVKKIKAKASELDLKPHELLLQVAQGLGIGHKQWKVQYDEFGNELDRELVDMIVYPDFETRLDCAKAAAPYYAARLATKQITVEDKREAPGTLVVPVIGDGDLADWSKLAEASQKQLIDGAKLN